MAKRLGLLVFGVVLAVAGAHPVKAADEPRGWLCQPKQASGFKYDGKARRWVSQLFKPGEAFVIQKPTDEDMEQFTADTPRPFWVVRTPSVLGGTTVNNSCYYPLNEEGFMSCAGWSRLDVNVKEGRYMETSWGSYMTRNNTISKMDHPNADTPAVTIGTCSPL